MTDERLPMDTMEEAAPQAAPPQEQNDAPQPPRDDAGRFAPRQEREPAGQPDEAAARRREREERDRYKREAEETKANYERLQKRLDDMASLMKGDEPAEQGQPDPLKPLAERLEAIDKRLSSRDEQEQEAAAFERVRVYADQDEARFRAQQPDFPNAVQHYITSRLTEIQAMGIDQAQAEQLLTQEAQSLLIQCAEQGRSPAETIYKLSQARGYTGSNVVPMQPQGQPQRPTGGRSLGTGGGAPQHMGYSAQQIAQMSEEDYEAFRATPEGRAAIRRAQGG